MTRASDFITDNPVDFVRQAVSFLENRVEDCILVIPEIIDFKRECQHFLSIMPRELLIYDNTLSGYRQRFPVSSDIQTAEHQHNNDSVFSNRQSQQFLAPPDIPRMTTDHSDYNNAPQSTKNSTRRHRILHSRSISRLRDRIRRTLKGDDNTSKEPDASMNDSTTSNEEETERLTMAECSEKQDENEQEDNQQDTTAADTRSDDGNVKHWTQHYDKGNDLDGEAAITWDIIQRINTANELIDDFLYKDTKKKSVDEKLAWFTRDRPFQAKALREYCRSEANTIRLRLNDLVLCLQLKEMTDKKEQYRDCSPACCYADPKKPKVDDFKDDMSDDSYGFWTIYFGQEICAEWKAFLDAYELLYGRLEYPDRAYIERVLVSKDRKLITVYGFIGFTRDHGFPFPKDVARTSLSTESEEISEEKRMKLTEMTMDLVKDFSSEEMRNHLGNIYAWFNDYKKDEDTIRQRADEWGDKMKDLRKRRLVAAQDIRPAVDDGGESRQDKQIDDIDKARRTVYFFYERFMVMWRVGEVSRDTLKDIDFPGKGRIRDFIKLVGALDHANYYRVMGNEKNDPKREYTPEIYDFMDEYLEILESQSKERKERKEARKKRRQERQEKRKKKEEERRNCENMNEEEHGNHCQYGSTSAVEEVEELPER